MMARLDGAQIDLVWVLVNLTHARINDLLAAAGERHRSRLPDALLSVNRSADGTQALVKVATTAAILNASLPPPALAVIARIFTEADHAEAVSLVTTPPWPAPAESEV